MLIAALLFTGGTSDPGVKTPTATAAPTAPVSVAAPESTSAATISSCAQVISDLPLTLDGAALRRTVSNPPSPSIVAWGDPAIVFRCGVAHPKQLTPTLADELFLVDHTALVLPHKESGATVFTIVDRPVFMDLTVPSSYSQPPLGLIVSAVAEVWPKAICGENTAGPRDQLCTRRP